MGADCLEGEGVCPLREQARDGLVIAVEGAEELIPFAVQHGSRCLAQALLDVACGREPGFLSSWITCKVAIMALFKELKRIGFIANRAKRTPTNVSEGLQKTQIFQMRQTELV